MLKAYVKLQVYYVKICNLIRFVTFMSHIWKRKVFNERNPQVVLRVVQEFLIVDCNSYVDTIKNNRSIQASANLISVLIEDYLENKAERTLEQIIEVLKEEFIKRK